MHRWTVLLCAQPQCSIQLYTTGASLASVFPIFKCQQEELNRNLFTTALLPNRMGHGKNSFEVRQAAKNF